MGVKIGVNDPYAYDSYGNAYYPRSDEGHFGIVRTNDRSPREKQAASFTAKIAAAYYGARWVPFPNDLVEAGAAWRGY